MGRAYEVRKASIQKTGAARGKLYSMYAREIYDAAKTGGTEVEANYVLKRLVEKAKGEQVPKEIIDRAIEKVNSGVDENYQHTRYELFGPAGSTIIVDCLTDNVNRSISAIRAVVNKCKTKIGGMGSVAYNYDNLGVTAFKGLSVDETMEILLEDDLNINSVEDNDGITVVYADPTDQHAVTEKIKDKLPNVEFLTDDIELIAKDTVKLSGEDLEAFNRLLTQLDEVEDVQHVYHNVDLN